MNKNNIGSYLHVETRQFSYRPLYQARVSRTARSGAEGIYRPAALYKPDFTVFTRAEITGRNFMAQPVKSSSIHTLG